MNAISRAHHRHHHRVEAAPAERSGECQGRTRLQRECATQVRMPVEYERMAGARRLAINGPGAQHLAQRLEAALARPSGRAQASTPAGVGPVPLEGYDHRKLHDPAHQTVKYVFGRVASHHALDGVTDKASAETLLRGMRPELEAAGLQIKDIKGDKILVKTEIGDEWVDVVRGAGGPNPGWWWGSEGKAVPGSTPLPTPPTPSPGVPSPGGPAPGEPGEALSTVPYKPEYANAPVDRSSPAAAALSAARWVKEMHPEYFNQGDNRDVAFQMMGDVIGALRAAGFDAHRVVNHPSHPVGSGPRYGSDAVVINGRIYDVYGGWGDPGASTPQALDVGAYAAGRLRE